MTTTDTSPASRGLTKYVPCPLPYYQGNARNATTSGDVLGVYCRPDEDVEWQWRDGRIVGYLVIAHDAQKMI